MDIWVTSCFGSHVYRFLKGINLVVKLLAYMAYISSSLPDTAKLSPEVVLQTQYLAGTVYECLLLWHKHIVLSQIPSTKSFSLSFRAPEPHLLTQPLPHLDEIHTVEICQRALGSSLGELGINCTWHKPWLIETGNEREPQSSLSLFRSVVSLCNAPHRKMTTFRDQPAISLWSQVQSNNQTVVTVMQYILCSIFSWLTFLPPSPYCP